MPTAANAGYYAEIVAEKAVLRRLVEAGTRIVQMGYHGAEGADVDEVVDRAQAEIYDVTERSTSEDYVPLEELLQPTMDEIERSPPGAGCPGVPTGFVDLDACTNGLHPGQMVVVAARPGLGKALALDTPLPTPTGWTTMGEVAVGDELIAADGTPTRVVAATEVMTGRPCYAVEFSDGSVTVADAEHQWVTETRAARRGLREQVAGSTRPTVGPAVRTTEQIAATLRCATADGGVNHSIEPCLPLVLPECQLPIEPYTLGVWLGDGTSAAAHFTSYDPEIADYVAQDGYRVVSRTTQGRFCVQLAAAGPVAQRQCVVCGAGFVPRTSEVRTCGRTCGGKARFISTPVPAPTCPDCGAPSSGLRRCDGCHRDHGSVQAVLRSMGVLGNKHIPVGYLRSSERQRRALLAGLLDTDGTVTSTGNAQFRVTNERLARGRLRAGRKPRIPLPHDHQAGARANRGFLDSVHPRLQHRGRDLPARPEAQAAQGAAAGRSHRRRPRYVTAVRPIASVPVRCVQVGNEDHLYLAGRSMVPTHNSTLGLDFCPVLLGEARDDQRDLLAGDEPQRDHDAAAVRRGADRAAPTCGPAG